MTPAVLGVTTLTVAQAVGNVAAIGPSLLDIQTYDNTHAGGDVRKNVRMALLIGGGLSLAVGFGASMATDSWLPLIGAAVGVLIIGAAYEWALRHQGEA